jgi:PAS domain S-box-containing protein
MRYKDLANLLPQLVVEFDEKGHFIFINDIGRDFIGYSKYELSKGITIFDLIHTDDLKSFKEEYLYLLEGGINKGQEFRIITKNGKTYFMVFYLKLIQIEADSSAGLRGFIIDITERKRLERQVLSAVLETEDKERRRYSEDLHDGLGPLLSTIKLYVNQMKSSKVTLQEEGEYLNISNELLDEAIATTRNIANNILPGSIVDNGLIAAVNTFTHHLNKAGDIEINFNHNFNDRLEKNIEINFYRIITELINNTIKHANATTIDISLIINEETIRLSYYDDGIGFKIDNIKHGLGLGNIINRSLSLSGEYDFNSNQNNGMTFNLSVRCRIPNVS